MRPTDFERVNSSKPSNTEIMCSVPFLGRCKAICVSYCLEHRGITINQSSVYVFHFRVCPTDYIKNSYLDHSL